MVNSVDISASGIEPPGWTEKLHGFCMRALTEIGATNWEVSVVLCDDPFIRELNQRYRGKDEPTDVLSFGQEGPEWVAADKGAGNFVAGDIVISLDSMRENARTFNVDEEEELKRLLIHGFLHLSGMDHADNSPQEPMIAYQERVLSELTEEHIF